ncbi:MAG: hypothetical protein CYG60_17470 [Actinobacteria bacterium]|nr:MAG: hypothetical protein CYG60_17470 [Actinomycetota bacterium]
MFGNVGLSMSGGGRRAFYGAGLGRLWRRFFGLFSGVRRRFVSGARRIRGNWWAIVQTAVAASAAWYLAGLILGHETPFVAPIAAVIALGGTIGREGRRAVEWVFGLALGLATADLLMMVIGTGPVQIAVVVGLAMAVALFLGSGAAFVTEAGVSAILVITLDPSTAGPTPDRFLDALVGCCVALAVHLISPLDTKRMVEKAARPVLGNLASALGETADALGEGDREKAERALRAARSLDVEVDGLKEILAAGYEDARLSPKARKALVYLGFYAAAADGIDLAVRNTRVLARSAVSAVGDGEPVPAGLTEAVRDLARSAEALAVQLEEPARATGTGYFALEAAGKATAALGQRNDLETNVLVGQVRSTAVDLLQASGMDSETASGALAGSVRGDS